MTVVGRLQYVQFLSQGSEILIFLVDYLFIQVWKPMITMTIGQRLQVDMLSFIMLKRKSGYGL